MKILAYGLFEAVNEYDQYGEYLRFVWEDKPTLEQISLPFGGFPKNDADTLALVKLWQGETSKFKGDPSKYTIREIKPGISDHLSWIKATVAE